MHIPSGASQTVELLDFESALTLSGQGDSYDRSRWLYVPDFYTEYRYILGTRGENPLICVGINPSTAEPDNLDPTLKSVERIAAFNGYDSFIMFNVYAQRATRPDDMDRALNERLHRENMAAFRYVLSRTGVGRRPAVWAAWGTIIEMVSVGEEYGARWLCAGKCSNKGHPHHPLYLRRDEPVRDFDVKAYLDLIGG